MKKNKPPVEPEDALLVAQAISELPYVTTAYETLVRRHYMLIYRTCLGMLRSPNEAEDVTQIVLLKVFNSISTFEGRSSFKTWLLRITTNSAINRINKLKLERGRYTHLTDASENELIDNNNPLETSLEKDGFDYLVCDLNNDEKTILSLRFVNDLSLEEISIVIGIKLSATKMRFYRALKKLKVVNSIK